MKHVEMIIDYIVDGEDFQYSDNHGVLIRCKDCKYFDPLNENVDYNFCDAWAGGTNEDMFCGFAERKEDASSR